jgi:hypothetical protein
MIRRQPPWTRLDPEVVVAIVCHFMVITLLSLDGRPALGLGDWNLSSP